MDFIVEEKKLVKTISIETNKFIKVIRPYLLANKYNLKTYNILKNICYELGIPKQDLELKECVN